MRPDQGLNLRLYFAVTQEQRDALEQAAAKRGMAMSELLRERVFGKAAQPKAKK